MCEKQTLLKPKSLTEVFCDAESFVKRHNPEILEWSRDVTRKGPLGLSKDDFLRKCAWVIYESGFRTSVVQKKWPLLLEAYKNFSVSYIAFSLQLVKGEAMRVIGNERKVDAILEIAVRLYYDEEFEEYKQDILENPDILEELPYIGKITKYHLARNIGIDTIKPDLHITRIAEHFGLDPFEMCRKLSEKSGYSLHAVDSILWRASEQGRINLV